MNSAEFKFKININPCTCCVEFLVMLGQKDWRPICQYNSFGSSYQGIWWHRKHSNTTQYHSPVHPRAHAASPTPLTSQLCPVARPAQVTSSQLSPALPRQVCFSCQTRGMAIVYLQMNMCSHLQAEQNRSHVTYKLTKSHRGDDAGRFAEQFSALLSSSATSTCFWHCPNGREPPLCPSPSVTGNHPWLLTQPAPVPCLPTPGDYWPTPLGVQRD